MHFPVYVVLPPFDAMPSGKDVERLVEQALAPHQYIERDRGGTEEPEVVQRGWWDWYRIGGSFEDPSHASVGGESGWKKWFRPTRARAAPVADLMQKWSSEWAPVRLVLPDGTVHGGHAWSDEAQARWVEEARQILERYRGYLFVVVDCHK